MSLDDEHGTQSTARDIFSTTIHTTMYNLIDDTLTISVNDWCSAGLTKNMFEHDSKQGYLSIYRRGLNGNTLIDVRSIKRPDRLNVLERVYGKIVDAKSQSSIFSVDIDTRARNYFTSYRKPDGTNIEPNRIEEYVNRASIFNALEKGLKQQIAARAKSGARLKMGEFWSDAADWFLEQVEKYPCAAIGNARSLERSFKEYLNGGYETLIHKNVGNDAARKVSVSIEKLLLALWRTNDKPFVGRVHELYLEFVSGSKELFDKNTGEVFRPVDFCHKGRAMEISVATVWNYLKDVVNNTAVYADRNGNFAYMDVIRPKKHRKPGKYSLSKISMDDVAMSRKSIRGWIYKYIAIDVVSGYYFRPAYVVGKPNAGTVIDSFRNMFCELDIMGLPMPGELEVEYHLMQDFKWLEEMFPFVRFCESPTEKRAEHKIKALKWGTAKNEGHTRGRWYAKHEAYRSVRNKVSGDMVEPTYQPQTIVYDDLADIEKHNNELHPLQKTYPGMTRKQVLMSQINPTLQPIDHFHLYKFIGNETPTSIYHNDYVPVSNDTFELKDFNNLKKLKSNDRSVTAYWLPNEEGSINEVYLWQGDTFIGEAINRSNTSYNECAIERTDVDNENMLHQNKRLAKFDKFVKEQKADIPKIGSLAISRAETYEAVEIMETVQPQGYETDDDLTVNDWAKFAKNSL